MAVPLSESWNITKSELVCVAIYHVYLYFHSFAPKSGLPFDLGNSRSMVFNSLPFLLLDDSV